MGPLPLLVVCTASGCKRLKHRGFNSKLGKSTKVKYCIGVRPEWYFRAIPARLATRQYIGPTKR